MVIILQQTSDNGHRFISTVVEEDLAALAAAENVDTPGLSSVDDPLHLNSSRARDRPQGASCNTSPTNTSRSTHSDCSSSFSLNSQHSISERSAIYKRRIDSLFGRQSKFNSFKPHLIEPFRVKIEDQNYSSRTRQQETSTSSGGGGVLLRRHSSRETDNYFIKGILQKTQNKSNSASVALLERPKQLRLCADSSSDDDGDNYQKIVEETQNFSSIVTDSLSNNLSRFNQVTQQNLGTRLQNRIGRNVTSVRITCGDEQDVDGGEGLLPFSGDGSGRSAFMRVGGTMGDNAAALICKTGGTRHALKSGSSAPCSSNSADLAWRNGEYDSQLPSSNSPPSSCPAADKDRLNSSPNLFHGCDLRFSVEYLGCIPVEGNTTALEDLQAPLCSLYTNYLNGKNILNGLLAITKDGLKFESPKLRLVNPFATIAVWAAIKFVARGEPNPTEFAFMPLISDPEGQDKGRLFGKMGDEFARIYRSKFDGGGSKPFRNPPLFACVMREATFSLDCHAFVCRCAEDAIVVAANLYQSLVDKMKSNCANPHGGGGKREGESGYGTLTRNSPANQTSSAQSPLSAFSTPSCSPPLSSNAPPHCHSTPNTGGGAGPCCSKVKCTVAASANNCRACASQDSAPSPDGICSDSESLLIPVRPPRKNSKKKHGAIKSNLKRYNSEDSILLKMPQRRVSINKARNCGPTIYRPQYIKNTKRVKISTPEEELSSSSSAPDFQLSESIDQVLDRIINPGGMSFNDLKPNYQQLLLKIALTLTQDQLYQKSKDAMKKHQLPLRANDKSHANGRRKKATGAARGTTAGIESEEQSQFLGAFLKSFSKITSGKMMTATTTNASGSPVVGSPSCSGSAAATSGSGQILKSFTGSKAKPPSKLPRKIILKKNGPAVPPKPKPKGSSHCKIEDASIMSFCSGCACDNCSEKCYCSLPSKQNVKIIRIPASTAAPPHGESESSSTATAKPDEIPTCSKYLQLQGNDGKPNGSCSNFGKCSPNQPQTNASSTCGSQTRTITTKICGYDTESCAGSEKCYCSLQRVKSNGLKIYNINLDTETSDTDTNSYDLEHFNPLEPTTTATSSSSNLKTVSTKSVEILSYHPARRLSYCSNSSPGSSSASPGSPNAHERNPTGGSTVQTNATVHYQHRGASPGNSVNGNKAVQKTNANSHQSPFFHSSPTPKGILCNGSYNKSHQSGYNKVRLVTDQDASTSKPTCSNYLMNQDSVNVREGAKKKNLLEVQTNGLNRNCNNAAADAKTNGVSGTEKDQVLSMKKTAEIAAMFKDLNLNRQPACSNSKPGNSAHGLVGNNAASKYDKRTDNLSATSKSSTDFQASLGYLP